MDDSEEKFFETVSKPVRVDWFLQKLVSLVNGSSVVDIPITINVGGSIIHGNLVGGKKYFDLFAEKAATVEPEFEGKQIFSEYLKRMGKEIYDENEKEDTEELSHRDYPHFVHLKDAVFLHHGYEPIPVNEGVLWRGRLESVDGFFLGEMRIEFK